MSRRRGKPPVAKAATPNVVSTWTGAAGTWQTLTDMLGLSNLAAPLSLQEALRNSAFLLCSDVIAQDHAKATLRMFERVDDYRRREVKPSEHSVAELLAAEPNDYHTWPEFVDMLVRHFCVAQNAFIAKKITTRGDVRELIPIVPGRITIFMDRNDGEFFYDLSRSSEFEHIVFRGFGSRLTSEQMIHVKGRLLEGLMGFSTLTAGSDTMSLARAIQDYQSKLYAGGGAHKPVFTLAEDQELSNEQFQRLRRQFEAMHQKALSGEIPLVLENGTDVKMLTMSAKDSEIAAASKQAILDVCRLFRMPPHKAMHLDAVKYENLDAMERSYISDTLLPISTKIEAALKRGLLLTREERARYFFEFDRDEMAANDAKARAEVAKIGVQTGVLEIDEARRELGFDPLQGGNGQVRLVPVNVSVVDRNNQVVVDGTAGAPGVGDSGLPAIDPLQQPANPPAKLLQLKR